MVDLALLQSVSYIAGALGVCVAAFYYALNLRENTRNRRVALTATLLQNFISEEGSKRWMELMQMEWKDFDDFSKKYDSSINLDNYAKRNTVFNTMDVLGYQYREGMIDSGTLWSICNDAVPLTWAKFKPLFDEWKRRGTSTKNLYENFEYLAYEMAKIIAKTDPGFKGLGVFKSDEYYEAFRKGKPAPQAK
jgi:hypothetical protein